MMIGNQDPNANEEGCPILMGFRAEDLLALELEEIKESDFDLSLTGFDPSEIDGLLALEDDEKANASAAAAGNCGISARRSVGTGTT